jgi:hypothetical protein
MIYPFEIVAGQPLCKQHLHPEAKGKGGYHGNIPCRQWQRFHTAGPDRSGLDGFSGIPMLRLSASQRTAIFHSGKEKKVEPVYGGATSQRLHEQED